MPAILTVTVAPPRSLLRLSQDEMLWPRLHRLARRTTTTLRGFWRALFAGWHRAVDPARLEATLRSSLPFDTESYTMGIWESIVELEARALLPVVLRETMIETGEIVAPAMHEVAGLPVPFVPGVDATRQALDLYAQSQVTMITATTMRGVRALDRVEEPPTLPPLPVLAALGLTPLQVRHLTTARRRWTTEGRSQTQIQAATQEAITQGLAQRTQVMAETQAYGTVNLAQHEAMKQAAQIGRVDLHRFWQLQPGACSQCRAIPGMNALGVPLQQPFQTPAGLVMHPPMHVLCRCFVDYRHGGA